MGGVKGIIGELVLKYIAENPDMHVRELARKLHAERPDVFKHVEHARGNVRFHKGIGSGKLRNTKGYEKHKEIVGNYYLKQSERKNKDDYQIKNKLIGIISDIHIPFHDLDSISCALDYFAEKNVDGILINGDLVDFYQLSRWTKNPEERSFAEEVKMTIEFLTMLRDSVPNIDIYYKMGNHEDRYENFLFSNAKELLGLQDFEFSNIFELDYLNVKLIGSRQKIQAGKLSIVHGHEFGHSVFSPVNVARGLFLRAKANALTSHHHQSSHHAESDINGNQTGCWSIGCLCDLRPDYRPFAFTKWNHGAALVEVYENGNFHVENFIIIDGKKI